MISISLLGLDPQPDVIYLGNRGTEFATALGFPSHTQVMTLISRENTPYFKYCADCRLNRIYKKTGDTKIGCQGGIRYLNSSPTNSRLTSRINETAYTVTESMKTCQRLINKEFSLNLNPEIPFAVRIPDYILVNRKHYSSGAGSKLKALLAKPDASSIDDLWNGIAFIFGNTYPADGGSVCLGSSEGYVDWDNWATIQYAYLNFSRNNDWTDSWRTKDSELVTLVDYATKLNSLGASFVNKFNNSNFRDWKRDIFHDGNFSSRFIIPFKTSYKRILFDYNRSNKFYIQLEDNTYIDTDLQPAEVDND